MTILNICFTYESKLYLSGAVHRNDTIIWGTDQPMEYLEIERNCPNLNVWCCRGMMCDRTVGPFFLKNPPSEQQITLTFWRCLHFYSSLQTNIIFQQVGAPTHWGLREIEIQLLMITNFTHLRKYLLTLIKPF